MVYGFLHRGRWEWAASDVTLIRFGYGALRFN